MRRRLALVCLLLATLTFDGLYTAAGLDGGAKKVGCCVALLAAFNAPV